jgi:hypothetical protein
MFIFIVTIFYVLTEESIDSNYDPSDSFFTTLPIRKDDGECKIQDDLAVSESEEEEQKSEIKSEMQHPSTTEEELGSVWF